MAKVWYPLCIPLAFLLVLLTILVISFSRAPSISPPVPPPVFPPSSPPLSPPLPPSVSPAATAVAPRIVCPKPRNGFCGWQIESECVRLVSCGSERRLYVGDVYRSVNKQLGGAAAVPFDQNLSAFWFQGNASVSRNMMDPTWVNANCTAASVTPAICNMYYWERAGSDNRVHSVVNPNNESLITAIEAKVNGLGYEDSWEDVPMFNAAFNCSNAINSDLARGYIDKTLSIQPAFGPGFVIYNGTRWEHRMMCNVIAYPDGARLTNPFDLVLDADQQAFFTYGCDQGSARRLAPNSYPVVYLIMLLSWHSRLYSSTPPTYELNYAPRRASTYPGIERIPCEPFSVASSATPVPPTPPLG